VLSRAKNEQGLGSHEGKEPGEEELTPNNELGGGGGGTGRDLWGGNRTGEKKRDFNSIKEKDEDLLFLSPERTQRGWDLKTEPILS